MQIVESLGVRLPYIQPGARDRASVRREHAARAFKAISGKETGYRHDGTKEARRAAMPRVWDVWYGYQELIEKEDRKPKEKP